MYAPSDESIRRTRGFVLALMGTFVFVFTSVIVLSYTHQVAYMAVAALSLAAVVLTYLAHRSLSVSGQVLFLVSASVALASEASFVAIYFPVLEAAAYTLATLSGSFVALKGVRDIESFNLQQAIPRRRREIPAVPEGI
jgi:hypothetical protein